VIDAAVRRLAGPALERGGAWLQRLGIRPLWVTAAGWLVGVGACVAAATALWPAALVLWLANRALDGLDGPVARAVEPTEMGGFLDIVADFSVYGGFVLGVAVAEPAARLACVALLVTYYVSGAAFLALSSLVERRGVDLDALRDERSLRFAGGLAEGAETVIAYVVFCVVPGHAAVVAWVFTAMVGITALQRARLGAHLLAADLQPDVATSAPWPSQPTPPNSSRPSRRRPATPPSGGAAST
jgi:phosphatidylglycerophosphate synthase